MEDEKQNIAEDSKERLNIINQITEDKAVSLADCLRSYLKITEKRNISERSLQNLSRILKVKGFINIYIESLRRQLLNVQKEDEVFEMRSNLQRQKEDKFLKSDEYNYVKQFAKKYGNKAGNHELESLQALLAKHQYDFSIEVLKEFIQYENWQKFDNFLNERVFVNNPTTLSEAIKIFLEHCNPNDMDMLISFAYLLKERGFQEIVAAGGEGILFNSLRAKIEKEEKEIELESFEKKLNEENEQNHSEDIEQFRRY